VATEDYNNFVNFFYGSHAPAWEPSPDAPASCGGEYKSTGQMRPDGIPTPARGNEKIKEIRFFGKIGFLTVPRLKKSDFLEKSDFSPRRN
jgi:hypothetical protein